MVKPQRYFARASKTRGRLLVLAVLAAIPITILAGVIAWQGFVSSQRMALDATSVFGGVAQGQVVRVTDALQRRFANAGWCLGHRAVRCKLR